jgi:hypothetical protein
LQDMRAREEGENSFVLSAFEFKFSKKRRGVKGTTSLRQRQTLRQQSPRQLNVSTKFLRSLAISQSAEVTATVLHCVKGRKKFFC